MPNRTRPYYRYMRIKAIKRKHCISKDYWHVEHLGVLGKGKIHCSCWMCSEKSKLCGRSISEQRKYPKDWRRLYDS